MSVFKRLSRRLLPGTRHPAPPFRVYRLQPRGERRGRVLISMGSQVHGDLRRGNPIPASHPAAWKNWNLARTFLDLGFTVDAAPSTSELQVDDKSFDVTVDVRANLEYLSQRLRHHGTRIYYPQFGHWTLHNGGQIDRHRDLLLRRGTSLLPTRLLPATLSVEHADHLLSPGGAFSNRGFAHIAGKIHSVEQAPPAARTEFVARNLEESRRHFVWIGGAGAVHKGLDLCIEAFAVTPDRHLHICGDITKEASFYAAYRAQLEQWPNIHLHGWTDTRSEQWMDIARQCAFVLLHSASEVAATSPVAGMFAGLIPVVNDGADQRYAESPPQLQSSSVAELIDCISRLGDGNVAEIADRSRQVHESALRSCTQEAFMLSIRRGICSALQLGDPVAWSLGDRPGERPANMPEIVEVTAEYLRH